MRSAAAPPRLPRPLAPWAEELAVFPHDLALSLGAWLERLSLAIGPWRLPALAGSGAPDGYGGVGRRGSYERLLHGEWLLAAELPQEFVRRAAMSEHSFFELQHEAPAGARRSVALFDAGPRQLGSPRVAQLALLLVLARRAAAAGASFAWGVLQDPAAGLTEGVDAAGVQRLVDTRLVSDATQREVEAWQLALVAAAGADDPRRADDLWLVGAPGLSQRAHHLATSLVEVADVLDPGRRQVTVDVMRWRSERHHLVLDLPPSDACARLLRNPLDAPPGAVSGAHLDLDGNLLFTPSGRQVIARQADGAVVAHTIGKGQASARRKALAPDERLVGVGWHKRRLVHATWSDERLRIHGLSGLDAEFLEVASNPEFVPPVAGAPLVGCYPGTTHRDRGRLVLVLDGRRQLFEVVVRERALRALGLVVEDVAWMTWGAAFLFRGGAEDGGPNLLTIDTLGRARRHAWSVRWPGGTRALLGGGSRQTHTFAAIEYGYGVWKIAHDTIDDVELNAGEQAIGLLARHWLRGRPELVTLTPDGREVRWAQEGPANAIRAPSRIASAAISHEAQRVALLTNHGQLQVYDLVSGQLLLDVLPGDAP